MGIAKSASAKKSCDEKPIFIVSGLPRSGTSMMMMMLSAGGVNLITDEDHYVNEDNPGGFFEFEKVHELINDTSWLSQVHGKAIKVISRLVYDLPADYCYKLIFMRRNLDEVIASQKRMLIRRGRVDAYAHYCNNTKIRDFFVLHLKQVANWLKCQSNFDVIYINYDDVVFHPLVQSKRINCFLGGHLNIAEMASVVNIELYRQRK